MIQLHSRLCGLVAVFGLAGLALAQARNSAWIVEPAPHSLTGEWVDFRASVPVAEGQTWHLLAENLATAQVDTLLAGQGPLDPASVLPIGPFDNAPWRLSLRLPASSNLSLPDVDFLAGRSQPEGFPLGASHPIAGLSALPTPWLDHTGLVWTQPSSGQEIRGASSFLYASAASGDLQPGFPVDLSRLGLDVYSGASPLRVAGSAGNGIVVLGKQELARFSDTGVLQARLALQGLPASDLLGWRTLAGEQRLAWSESQDGVLRLRICDGDLDLLQEATIAATPLQYQTPLCLADLEGDLVDELWCALYDSPTGTTQVYRLDPGAAEATLVQTIGNCVPQALLSGELNGDHAADLLLQTDDRLHAFDGEESLWTVEMSLETASRPVLAELDQEPGQDVLLMSWQPDAVSELHALAGASGQPLDIFQPSGLETNERAVQAPLVTDWDGDGSPDLVLATHIKNPAHFYGRVRVLSANGGQLDSWYQAGVPLSGLRMHDLDGDGLQELLLQDSEGRLNAWSTGSSSGSSTRPLGDSGNTQRFARPLEAGTFTGGWLEGTLYAADTLELSHAAEWRGEGFRLASGWLRVRGLLMLQGDVVIAQGAGLEFRAGSQIPNQNLELRLAGTLLLKGQSAPMEQALSSQPTSLSWILNKMDLHAEASATVRMENVLIVGMQRALDLGPGRQLQLEDSWLIDGESIRLSGAGLSARNCLLKGHGNQLLLQGGAQAFIERSSFSSSDQASIRVEGSSLHANESLFLCNTTGLRIENPLEVLMDSCHFQGNTLAVDVVQGAAAVRISNSDFVDCGNAALRNQDPLESVDARYCFWNDPQAVIGLADLAGSSAEPYFEPELPAPIFDLQPSPMIEGDEPLLTWQPVQFTQSGIPVSPAYRVYRSADPYAVILPENLVATITETSYYGEIEEGKTFFVIQPWLGKVGE